MRSGQKFYVRDMLYALMLESFNDCAVVLAEYAAGSVEEFAKEMNRKAAELGCENSHFVTPNGLDGQDEGGNHHTTAKDLAAIMRYCITESPKREEFLEITRASSYSFHDVEGKRSYHCNNHNAFLGMMPEALSGKTGFTNNAGYCYVGALESEGRIFTVALLACGWPNNKNYKWSDTRELMQYGIEHFFYRSFSEEGIAFDEELLGEIPVGEGQTQQLGQRAYTGLHIIEKAKEDEGTEWEEGLLLRDDEEIRVRYSVKKELTAPVEKGTQVGTIDYMVGDTVYKQDAIVTADTVERIDLEWCMRQILNCFFLPKTP